MWERAMLKFNAKTVLRRNYWPAFAVCLVSGLIMGGFSGASARASGSTAYYFHSPRMVAAALAVASFIGIIAIAYGIFIASPVAVGRNRYFMESRLFQSDFATLFSAFKSNYLNVVGASVLTNLYIFLWSLLLIVPGVIKYYQYRFVPYLLAENPGMTAQRAQQLSTLMTNGEKLNIFVLDLSFIGWYLLGALACGLGVLFVTPYQEATNAELYAMLRARAFSMRWTDERELTDFFRRPC